MLSHTVSTKKLDEYLSFSKSKYQIILASACKMASIEKFKIMGKYSKYAVASPENIHLAHFDIKNLSKNLKGFSIEKGKRMLELSFNRLTNYTKSNLVLNLYNLEMDFSSDDICNSPELIIYNKTKLSLFETRNKLSKEFIILDCK